MALLPGGRGSELVRELSGTDSETVTYGTSGTTEVAGFAAGPRQFANKFAYALRAESRAGLYIAHDQAASKGFTAGAGG
ncbi:hypothetical protein, partial [Pseudomonas syringae]|uniref:hypothetical protein n=1 Tax=Pseudomonas syringae TaxID=317 RepID=UPI001C7E6514